MACSSQRVSEDGLPSVISFVDGAGERPKRVGGRSDLLQALGLTLRNNLYLPLMSQSVDQEQVSNQKLAERTTAILRNPGEPCSKKLAAIRRYFSLRDIDVRLEGPVVRIFTIRLFESKRPIAGKKLRMILFCFNGNRELTAKGGIRSWNPLRIDEVSGSPLSVLRALQSHGVEFGSLITNSLGNLIFEGLKNLPAEEAQIIPRSIIVNRGFTSAEKVGNRLFPFPLNCILYTSAKLSGWDADAETGLLNFCSRISQDGVAPSYQVVIIEAKDDYFFSGHGALEADLHLRIAQLGVRTFRAQFWPCPFHSRSHHTIPLNHVKNNSETDHLLNTEEHFPLGKDQKLSRAIAKNIFLEEKEDWHTSFVIGGADETLDIATEREIIPLLLAFIREGEKIETLMEIQYSLNKAEHAHAPRSRL
jgi:hypothetical protein